MAVDEVVIIPGGWKGKNKPGHAMLYLVTFDSKFIIINTGAGINYHPKKLLSNLMQFNFLSIKLKNKSSLNELVLPSLIEIIIKPNDYNS